MCAHEWKKVNDTWICMRCGLTRLEDGFILYDKYILDYKPMGKRRKKRKG